MTSSTKPHIGIVIGSIREARFGEKPAKWLYDIAKKRSDATFKLLDLRDFPLPFFDEAVSPAMTPSTNQVAVAWSAALAKLDGLVIVTPEYNHAPPAVVKNALDYAYDEFNRKPIAFLGYGGAGAARSIEQLRLIAVTLQMAPIRGAVHIGLSEFLGIVQQGKSFDDYPHLGQSAQAMLDDLIWWTNALTQARIAS